MCAACRPAVHRLFGVAASSGRPGPDQSPLRRRMRPGPVDARAMTMSSTATSPRPREEERKCSGHAGRDPDRDHRRHADRCWRRGKGLTGEALRQGARRPSPRRSRRQAAGTERHAAARWSASTTAASTSSTSTASIRTCAWSSRRSSRRPSSAAIPTTSTSRATTSISRFLRVYENGEPVETPDHLHVEPAAPKEGEPVFVAGNPGRHRAPADRGAARDPARRCTLPMRLLQLVRTARPADPLQRAKAPSRSASRTRPAVRPREQLQGLSMGGQFALDDDAFIASKARDEAALQAKVAARAAHRPPGRRTHGRRSRRRARRPRPLRAYLIVEGGPARFAPLQLSPRPSSAPRRSGSKPIGERLRGLRAIAASRCSRQQLSAPAPVYPASWSSRPRPSG